MIKPNELRLGNFVSEIEWMNTDNEPVNEKNIITVELITKQDTTFLYPIPLTEYWLLKFGFQKIGFPVYHLGELSISIYADYTIRLDKFHGFDMPNVTIIKFVHQLQNLYFALTGEELTIKQHATI